MATYTVTSEGAPILPINLEITFPVNHTVNLVDAVISNKSGTELEEQFEAYTLNVENQTKESADFSTQDTGRNGTFILTETGPGAEGYTQYNCAMTFTIENAVVTLERQVQTDLTGTAKDTFLEDYANTTEVNYLAERPWIAL
jgi:hypothetical protein